MVAIQLVQVCLGRVARQCLAAIQLSATWCVWYLVCELGGVEGGVCSVWFAGWCVGGRCVVWGILRVRYADPRH